MSLQYLSDDDLKEYHTLYAKMVQTGSRHEHTKIHSMDVKSAYHIVRLMLEAEMVLNEGDLDLEKHREQLKFVRRGGYTLEELKEWFLHKEKELTTAHTNSSLPLTADFDRIGILLRECLEISFGSLDIPHHVDANALEVLEKIRRLMNK